MVVSIEGGLQDASGEDDFILGWKIVRIDSLGRHAPPGGGRSRLAFLLSSCCPARQPRPALPVSCKGLGPLLSSPPRSPGLPLQLPLVCPPILTGLGWEVCGAGQPSPWQRSCTDSTCFGKKSLQRLHTVGIVEGRKKARDNMLEKGRVPAGPFQAGPSLLHCKMEGNG